MWSTAPSRFWYSDEHALALGCGRSMSKPPAAPPPTNYPITALTSNPGVALNAAVGTTRTTGDQAGTRSVRPTSGSLAVHYRYYQRPEQPQRRLAIRRQRHRTRCRFGTWKGGRADGGPHHVNADGNSDLLTPIRSKTPGTWAQAPMPRRPVTANEGYGAEVR